MLKAAQNILETIGNTPLVRIVKLNPNPKVEIFAKLEGSNPVGSVKDRIALTMIEEAEKTGKLTKEKTLVEATSGNTGIGLAMVAAVKGYRLMITMPDNVSTERRQMLRAMGAEIVLTPGEKGTDGAWDRADEIYAGDPRKYFRIHQYKDPANVKAHYDHTGPEIWEQMEHRVDYLVVGLGTTGTLVGAGRFLKIKNPRVKIIAIEPEPKHKQQGLRSITTQRVPDIYEPSLLDEKIIVKDADAFQTARRIIREEGIFVGISSGSALWGCWQVAKKAREGARFAVIFPDRGEKYFSTDLFPVL
jgi:cysteine synthase